MNLKSSMADMGKKVTQIIYNNNGLKKTIHGVRTDTIEQSQFTRFDTVDGKRFYINDANVWMIEVHDE